MQSIQQSIIQHSEESLSLSQKIKRIIELESKYDAINANIRALKEVATPLAKEANELREQVIAEMEKDGLVKDTFDNLQISLRQGLESVDVVDINAVPDEYLRKEPNKEKIRKDKPAGNWYVMKRGAPTLQIKGIAEK